MTALSTVPARRIVRAIADAAQRWSDADFPPRVRVLSALVARTGYSAPVCEYALDRLFEPITVPALEAIIVDELGSLDVLDGCVERRGRPNATALPVGRVCAIASRTTIGVAIVPAIFALLAKCDVLVKDREDGLVRAFFTTLAEELDAFRDAAQAAVWDGADHGYDLHRFDAVTIFGEDATLATVRTRLASHARFIGFGSKASIGYVARDATGDPHDLRTIADGAARDLLLYDTEGCLSLHALFLERGGALEPATFAHMLAAALERASIEFPLGARNAAREARVAHARNAMRFRASEDDLVIEDPRAEWFLHLSTTAKEAPAFLPRTLRIIAVDDTDEALAYLRRHDLHIEAMAVAAHRADIVRMALEARITRIAPFGELQAPPLGGYHGGHPRIAEYVRWMSDER